jgi:UPF0716 protein FxsA
MWPFALFLVWPLVEIALFVTVGGAIGLGATLLVILGSGALGVWLLRGNGLRTAERLRREMDALRNPVGPVANGALMMLAAVLLILPGFLTDALGLLLLLPPVRAGIVAALARKVRAHRPEDMDDMEDPFAQRARRGDIIIDGEFIEVEHDPDRAPPRPSGWTRH